MYETLYVIQPHDGLALAPSIVGVLLAGAAGLVMFRVRFRLRALFLAVYGVLVLAMAGLMLWSSVAVGNEADRLATAMREHRCEVVEGVVKVLRQESSAGHTPPEMVSVGERTFTFSYFSNEPGYHTTVARGGVLVDGAQVRLCAVGPHIVQIDVDRTPIPPMPTEEAP